MPASGKTNTNRTRRQRDRATIKRQIVLSRSRPPIGKRTRRSPHPSNKRSLLDKRVPIQASLRMPGAEAALMEYRRGARAFSSKKWGAASVRFSRALFYLLATYAPRHPLVANPTGFERKDEKDPQGLPNAGMTAPAGQFEWGLTTPSATMHPKEQATRLKKQVEDNLEYHQPRTRTAKQRRRERRQLKKEKQRKRRQRQKASRKQQRSARRGGKRTRRRR